MPLVVVAQRAVRIGYEARAAPLPTLITALATTVFVLMQYLNSYFMDL